MSIERLYKYGRLGQYSEGIFSGSQVWFARPSELNDPFECRPWFTYEGTEKEVFETIVTGLRKQKPLAPREQVVAEATEICQRGHHRTPEFWETLRADLVRMLGAEIGLYCLAEKPNSILMWSHYSGDHKGYCLEFEATNHTVVFDGAQKVRYSESYPSVDFFNTAIEEQVELIFLTKYAGWTYEQEWRIVDHEIGPGLRRYPPELLRGVIFGLRMPADHKAQIREWVSHRGHPIKFYQAMLGERTFSIEIKEIT